MESMFTDRVKGFMNSFKVNSSPCGSKSEYDDLELSTTHQQRVDAFSRAISRDIISIPEIRRLAFEGIPDVYGLRATYWKLLVGYYPIQPHLWPTTRGHSLLRYTEYCTSTYLNSIPISISMLGALGPLSCNTGYCESDLKLYSEIKKDVARTYADMHFFAKKIDSGEYRHQFLHRILYIYAKLHPSISYAQGMNELIAPIYYVCATDSQSELETEVEAYFCFTKLMSTLYPRFIASSNGALGTLSCVNKFKRTLFLADATLSQHLDTELVEPQYYCFRWLSVLVSREFPLPEVIRVWDSLLSDPCPDFQFLYYFCAAMLLSMKQTLLSMSYSDIIHTLQNYPCTDVDMLFDLALMIRRNML